MKIVSNRSKVEIFDDTGKIVNGCFTRMTLDMTADKRECVLTTVDPYLEIEVKDVVLKPDFKSGLFLQRVTMEDLEELEKKVKNLIYVKKTKK